MKRISRMVGPGDEQRWDNRGHFFAAAAEAMRRILVEKVRRKDRLRDGGGRQQDILDEEPSIVAPVDPIDLLALNKVLDRLEVKFPRRAQLVKLRYFAGFTLPEVAQMLGISQSTAEADWTYAKAWLRLVWLSVCHRDAEEEFARGYRELYHQAEKARVAVAIGGRALVESLRLRIPYTTYGDGLGHLAAFARTLHPRPPPRRGRPPRE
jgi:RNA polymerase sigma factor (TIGR02999 family)